MLSLISKLSNPVLVHIMHVARTADSLTKQQIRVLALDCIAVHVAMLEFSLRYISTYLHSELSLRLSQLAL